MFYVFPLRGISRKETYFRIFIALGLVASSLFFIPGVNAEVARTTVTVTAAPFPETQTIKSIPISSAQSFSITNADNISVDFTIPQNVYSENLRFSGFSHDEIFFGTNHPAPPGKAFTNKVYNFVFEKLDGQPVQTVNNNVTITLHYSDADLSGLAESTLVPYRKREGDTAWSLISGGTVDTINNTVTFATNQFSFFALFAEPSLVCGNGILQSGEQCDDGNTNSGDGCSASCQTEAQAPSPGGGGGGGAAPPVAPIATSVVLKGKAYPYSDITILKDGGVAASTLADSQANFSVQITDVTAGVYTFGLWAEDKAGAKSITFSFTTSVSAGTITTIGGIFLPPTISVDKTNVARGDNITFLGQTAPKSEIVLQVNSEGAILKKTTADAEGLWSYAFDTTPLEEGSHTSKAKATSPDSLLSSFSKVLSFVVGRKGEAVVRGADLNGEGKVNLIDFSILLFNWGVPKNPAADFNNDGIVNIVDFSILLFWWTG